MDFENEKGKRKRNAARSVSEGTGKKRENKKKKASEDDEESSDSS